MVSKISRITNLLKEICNFDYSLVDPSFANYVMLSFFFLAIPIVIFAASAQNNRLQVDLDHILPPIDDESQEADA